MIRPRGTQRQAAITALLAAWPQRNRATELDLKVAPLISNNPAGP